MKVGIYRTETEWHPKKEDSIEDLDEQKFKELVAEGELNFDGWTQLILDVENLFHHDIEKLCLVYDSFLSEFPLCYGYWKKYADHMMHLSTIDKAVDVFERAVQSATYSVSVWVDYCSFAVSVFEDDNDIRRLFKRAMSFVGKDYLSHTLWDKYLEFEFSRQQWGSLAHVYIQTLRFPSKKLHSYYESVQKLATTWKEETQCTNDMDLQSEPEVENEASSCYTDTEISCIIKDLLDAFTGMEVTKALTKYLSIGKRLYREASELDEKLHHFEVAIRRPYFHVKELDISQLENWHMYLNFVEMHGDFDWAVKLYERCLIPCANYPEFWMRYVDFMESKGGREIANFALVRATEIFLKRMPVIHLFSARFKENIKDVSGAHVALHHYETESDLSFVETVSIKANMERRLGNFIAASNTYKEAVEIAAAKQEFDILPILYINFSRLEYMITSNSDAARDILIDGIKCLPHCKLLLEELIKFGMVHGGHRNIHVLDSIINDVVSLGPSQGMDAKEAEEVSRLYLQFVDLCGTIDDTRKAWNRHIKCFPDAARTNTYKCSVVNGIKPILMKMAAVRRKESPGSLPSHPSGDGSSDISVQSPSQDKILKPPENDDAQPNHAASDSVPDKKSPLLEDHENPLYQATLKELQTGEVDESLQGGMQHSSQDVSKHLIEDIKANTNMSSHNLIRDEVANEVEALEPSEEISKEKEFQLERDHNSEHDVNGLPLKKLSLGHLDREALDSISIADQGGETFVETRLSNESMVKKEPPQETSKLNEITPEGAQSNGVHNLEESIPRNAQASDAAGIQAEMAGPSSSANQQNFKKTEPVLQRTPPDDGSSWHQRNSVDRVHRENKPGHRRPSHKRLHHRQHMSPKRQYLRSGTSTQVSMSQSYPSQSMYSQSPQVQQGGQSQSQYPTSAAQPNLATVPSWSAQNMHQQNFAPSQTPVVSIPANPQPQIPQHPMQSNDQLGQMQNNQAYNQMWQYYYYQQQQEQQQQQFLLQQQQQQPQHQEPLAQQQLLQQQQYQQHQVLQVQQQFLQQQPLPYQQPQLQQLQQQQQFVQQQQQQYLQQQQQLLPLGSYQQQVSPSNHHIYLQQQQHQQQKELEKGQGQITLAQVKTQGDLSKEESMIQPMQQRKLQDQQPCRNDDAEIVLSAISPNSQQ